MLNVPFSSISVLSPQLEHTLLLSHDDHYFCIPQSVKDVTTEDQQILAD